jgi:hypothetical protein
MGVEDPAAEGGMDRLAEHGAEPGHHHHLDVRVGQCPGERPGVPLSLERRAESPELGTVDQDGRDGGVRGNFEGTASPVCHHQPDREVGADDRLEDGAAAGGEDGDPHGWGVARRSAGAHGRTLPATFTAHARCGPAGARR